MAGLREIDAADQLRRTGVFLPLVVPGGERRRVGRQGVFIDLEGDVRTRDLAVEVVCEFGRALLQRRLQARALGLTHLAKPAILQPRKHADEYEETDAEQNAEGPTASPHARQCSMRDRTTRPCKLLILLELQS